jgi:hypothetical protein
LVALGVAPRGVIEIGGDAIRVTETSRNRNMATTMPTAAVRTLTFELARRLLPIVVGVPLLLIGAVVAGIGIGRIDDESWWPDLADLASGEEILAIGAGIFVLGLIAVGLFAFRRDLVIRFDVGGSGGARIHLRRSWGLGMRFKSTLSALTAITDIVMSPHGSEDEAATPPTQEVAATVATPEPPQ